MIKRKRSEGNLIDKEDSECVFVSVSANDGASLSDTFIITSNDNTSDIETLVNATNDFEDFVDGKQISGFLWLQCAFVHSFVLFNYISNFPYTVASTCNQLTDHSGGETEKNTEISHKKTIG